MQHCRAGCYSAECSMGYSEVGSTVRWVARRGSISEVTRLVEVAVEGAGPWAIADIVLQSSIEDSPVWGYGAGEYATGQCRIHVLQ